MSASGGILQAEIKTEIKQEPSAQGAVYKQGAPRLLDFLCFRYKTNDLINLDPIAIGLKRADDRSRQRTLQVRTYFEGSAAEFQAVVDNGGRVRVTVGEMLQGQTSRLYPRGVKHKDAQQGLTPLDFDIDAVLVNTMVLAEPRSTMLFGVGIGSNVLPEAYKEIRDQQVADLQRELGVKPSSIHIVAHIPANSKDPRNIPILKEVANAFNAEAVARTFGGIVPQHLWAGLISLSPKQCMEMDMHPPPASHEPADPPPGQAKAYNSWVIVPHGHVLSHICNLPPADLARYNYAVYQLRLPSGEPIPFLLMDTWTIHMYATGTAENAIKKMDHRRLADVDVELFPLTRDTWLNSCRPGEHFARGRVEFTVVIRYTMFPKNFRQDPTLIPTLSAGFPRLSQAMRNQLGGGAGNTGAGATQVDMRERIAEQRLMARQKTGEGANEGKGKEEEDGDVVMQEATE